MIMTTLALIKSNINLSGKKYFLKYWVKVLLFPIFNIALHAQNFNLDLQSTAASCIGNGAITVSLTNVQPDSQLEFNFYLLPNTAAAFRTFSVNNPGASDFQHIENSLPAGSYLVVVAQATLSQTFQLTDSITITDTSSPLIFSVSQHAICNDQNVLVNVSSGNAISYELRDNQGNTIVGPQQSNLINNVTPGTYVLVVSNNCGSSVGLSIQVAPALANYLVYRNGQQYRFDNLTHCDSIGHTSRLIFNGTNVIPAERFPITVTYTTVRQNGETTTNTHTWLNNSHNFQSFNIPFYSGESYNFIVTGVDACGTTFSRTDNIIGEPKSLFRTFPSTCGTKHLKINSLLRHYPPVSVTFTAHPAGFEPSNYNASFASNSISATYNTLPQVIDFGSPNLNVPEGNYTIKISSCGRTETINRQVINDDLYNITTVRTFTGCEAGQGSVHLQIRLIGTAAQGDNFVSIQITSAPQSFIDQFGSLPYDANSNIATNGQFYMNGLPPGNYAVVATGVCGVPVSGNFIIHQKQVTFNKSINQACGLFSINTTMTSTLGSAVQWLQKYYPESNKWGHPITGELYNEGEVIQNTTALTISPATSGNGMTTSNGSSSNINSFGIFRIAVQYAIHNNGASQNIICREILDEFEVQPFGISINDYFVFNCVNGGSELTINATGIPPLSYTIIEFNNEILPTPILNGTNHIFSNLEHGLYKIKIEDLCGNAQVLSIQTNTTIPPVITPFNLCENVNGALVIWGLGAVDITWQKEPSTDIIGQGNTLSFQPFSYSTHAGVYNALVTSPSGSCNTQILSFEISNEPNIPNAGIGQIVEILESNASAVHLFNLLTPPYDDFGLWTEITTSDQHNGALFNAQDVEPGTYIFEYVVNGSCSGSDTAQVIINIISEALLANADNYNFSCPFTSPTIIGNVMDNDVHFANPVVFENYMIETLVTDPFNVISVDQAGNIWVSANSTVNDSYQLNYKISYTSNPSIYSSSYVTVNIAPDISAPVFLGVLPEDTLVSCEQIPNPETLSAQNDCGAIPVSYSESLISGNCANEFTLIRTWTALTSEGLESVHVQHIHVVDTTQPVNVTLQEIFVTSSNFFPLPNTDDVLALANDNCSNVSVAFINDQSDNQTCPETIVRTYRITDDCGNFTDVHQNIIVHDTIAPWASNLPFKTLACIDQLPLADVSLLTDAQDNVELTSIVHLSDQSNNQNCSEIISRTYRLQDACNNHFDVIQLFFILDTIAPQASTPIDIFVACPNEIPAADVTAVVNATDNCGAVIIEHSADIQVGNICSGGQIQRIYTISDQCQNSIQISQIIHIDLNLNNNLSFSTSNPSKCNGYDGSIIISGMNPDYGYTLTYNGLSINVNPDSNGDILISGLNAGTYSNFILQPLDCSACAINTEMSVTLNDPVPPFISAGSDFSLCLGLDAVLSAYNPQNAIISWSHGVIDGMPFEPGLGTEEYILTGMLLECYAYDTILVTVHQLPNVYAGEDQTVCENESITHQAIGAQTYYWSNDVANGEAFYQSETYQYYVVSGMDANGCVNVDSINITVIPSPVPTFDLSLTESCANPTNVVHLNTTESITSIDYISWHFDAYAPSTNTNQVTVTYAEIGCYDVTLTLTYINGCTNSSTKIDAFCILPGPTAGFQIVTQNPQVGFPMQMNNLSENASSFEWQFGEEQSNFMNPDIMFNQHGSNVITLIAFDDLGCSDTISQVIHVNNVIHLYVPNTFTPNGDKFNNLFTPIIGEGVKPDVFNMSIFSRWGDLVYETKNIEIGWDGTKRNLDCPDGDYLWKIEFKAQDEINHVYMGHVTLIR
jgi:gliding motility-associated-like protein